jgi:hypothetical protein
MCYSVRCADCHLLDGTLEKIVLMLDKQKNDIDGDQYALMIEDLRRNSGYISNWKRHQLRSVHQDLARDYILEKLDDSNVFIIIDWAMKWVEAKYREKQSEWYGKKGLPWHLTFVIRRQRTHATLTPSDVEKKFEHRTLCHVFDQCKQDALSVVSIIEDVLPRLKANDNQLRFAYLRSDNGACYHSTITTTAVQEIFRNTGVLIRRIDFSEPQAGKGPCDRRAAVIKGEVRRHVNEKHNCTNSVEFVQASKSTQHLSVFASELSLSNNNTLSEDSTKRSTKTSWAGISNLFNLQYESSSSNESSLASDSGASAKVSTSALVQGK